MRPFTTSRMITVRLPPPDLPGGIKGSTSSHSSSVKSLGYRNLLRSYRPRFLLVHIGDPSSNQATTLESQMIHMIQELFGQTLSVPFRPRGPAPPTSVMPRTDNEVFYQLYFQAEGIAEKEFEKDVRRTVRLFLAGSPNKDSPPTSPMVPRQGGWLGSRPSPPSLPNWITENDIDFYAAELERTGFSGGLNWYRNIDRNCELMAPWSGAKVGVPALYMAGDRDLVVKFPGMDQLIANLKQFVPKLQQTIILPDCGHWTQQEKADEVNSALIAFLKSLDLK